MTIKWMVSDSEYSCVYCTVAQFGVGAAVVVFVFPFLSFDKDNEASVSLLKTYCLRECSLALPPFLRCLCAFASMCMLKHLMLHLCANDDDDKNMCLFSHRAICVCLQFGVRYLFICSTFASIPPLTIIIRSSSSS